MSADFLHSGGIGQVGLDYIPAGSNIGREEAVELQRLAWEATQLWNVGRGLLGHEVAGGGER